MNLPDISDIRNKDDKLFELVSQNIENILLLTTYDEIKITSNVLISFFNKLGFLKTSILDVSETGNIYSVNVLFRSFLEHMLRANYIFMRWVYERNEDAANDYLSLKASEDFDYLKALKWISEKETKTFDLNPLEILNELYPHHTFSNNKDIKKNVKIFTYKELISSINEFTNIDIKNEGNFIYSIVPHYCQLSSFIHGGPKADEFLKDFQDEKKREKSIFEICSNTILMQYTIFRYLFLILIKYDQSKSIEFNEFNSLMNLMF